MPYNRFFWGEMIIMSYHNISGAPEPFLAEVELQTITGCSELPRPHGQVFPVRREALMRYLSSGVTFRGPHGSFIQYIYVTADVICT